MYSIAFFGGPWDLRVRGRDGAIDDAPRLIQATTYDIALKQEVTVVYERWPARDIPSRLAYRLRPPASS